MPIFITPDLGSAVTTISGLPDTGEFQLNNFADGDTYPDVDSGKYFMTNNSAPTAISGFNCTASYKTIVVLINDNNTTFVNGSLLLEGGLTMAVSTNDTVQFAYDGSNWRLIGVSML
jgi:hypothetical protein